ncbi:MAG TPA: hypothetical protein VGJ60_07160 [Chloroflexota bacterium]
MRRLPRPALPRVRRAAGGLPAHELRPRVIGLEPSTIALLLLLALSLSYMLITRD